MKKVFKIILFLSIIWLLNFSFFGIKFGQPDLVIHEWGTFTSSFTENGKALDKQRFEGRTTLPKEVYTVAKASFPKRDKEYETYSRSAGYNLRNGLTEGVGFLGINVKNDFVRMETPVLYFYSPKEMDIDVSVKFPNGSIGEWYPPKESQVNYLVKNIYT